MSSSSDAEFTDGGFDVDRFLMPQDWQPPAAAPPTLPSTGLPEPSTDDNDLLSGFLDELNTSGFGEGFALSDNLLLPVDYTPPSTGSSPTTNGGLSSIASFDQHHWINNPQTSPSSDGDSTSPNYDSTSTDVCIDVELEYSNKVTSSDRVMGSVCATQEEIDLLSKEGIVIPTDLPLTKAEEKHVKRIRRKIKNKQSAADSRKRKKEYMDGLENRVVKCTEMNTNLMKKVKQLENENKSLVEQLKRLQGYVAQYNPSKLQAGSFMMIVILSFSLLVVPQMYRPSNIRVGSLSHARSLLDISSDEFGNLVQGSRETGYIGFTKDKRTPLPPLPWEYRSPALRPWNSTTLH